jgi:hypothetical protein
LIDCRCLSLFKLFCLRSSLFVAMKLIASFVFASLLAALISLRSEQSHFHSISAQPLIDAIAPTIPIATNEIDASEPIASITEPSEALNLAAAPIASALPSILPATEFGINQFKPNKGFAFGAPIAAKKPIVKPVAAVKKAPLKAAAKSIKPIKAAFAPIKKQAAPIVGLKSKHAPIAASKLPFGIFSVNQADDESAEDQIEPQPSAQLNSEQSQADQPSVETNELETNQLELTPLAGPAINAPLPFGPLATAFASPIVTPGYAPEQAATPFGIFSAETEDEAEDEQSSDASDLETNQFAHLQGNHQVQGFAHGKDFVAPSSFKAAPIKAPLVAPAKKTVAPLAFATPVKQQVVKPVIAPAKQAIVAPKPQFVAAPVKHAIKPIIAPIKKAAPITPIVKKVPHIIVPKKAVAPLVAPVKKSAPIVAAPIKKAAPAIISPVKKAAPTIVAPIKAVPVKAPLIAPKKAPIVAKAEPIKAAPIAVNKPIVAPIAEKKPINAPAVETVKPSIIAPVKHEAAVKPVIAPVKAVAAPIVKAAPLVAPAIEKKSPVAPVVADKKAPIAAGKGAFEPNVAGLHF